MKSGLSILKDNMKKVASSLASLEAKQVLVGVPADKAPREGEPINNASIGYLNENGSPAQNIPARPHLEPGIKSKKDEIAKTLAVGARTIIERGVQGLDSALTKAGIIGQNSVKQIIREQDGFESLAPATLAARKRAGAKGDKALIRTGSYINSITYVLRKK